MYYEINISKRVEKGDGYILSEIGKYHHLFATAKRSCTSIREATKVLKELLEKFPSPLYQISMIKWTEEGIGIDPKKFFTENWDERIDG